MFKLLKKFNVKKVFKKKNKPLKEKYYGTYDVTLEELENGELYYSIHIEGKLNDKFKSEK